MIELKNLSFSYPDRPVLQDLSSAFAPGTLYGIVGPNGCGKTTLIRLLCGLLSPLKGSISLDGRPYEQFSLKERARQISLMPQFRTLPSVSGEELVLRGRYPHLGLSRRETAEDRQMVKEALQRAGATALAHRNVTRLSGGERQRICLAMLYAQNTPYVLLDEPTSFLDLSHRFALMEQMRGLCGEGKCVIAVLHDLSIALRCCDRVLVLDEGRIGSFASPAETVASGVLEKVFSLRCLPVSLEGKTEYLFLPK